MSGKGLSLTASMSWFLFLAKRAILYQTTEKNHPVIINDSEVIILHTLCNGVGYINPNALLPTWDLLFLPLSKAYNVKPVDLCQMRLFVVLYDLQSLVFG